jgi:hypothetical protein
VKNIVANQFPVPPTYLVNLSTLSYKVDIFYKVNHSEVRSAGAGLCNYGRFYNRSIGECS